MKSLAEIAKPYPGCTAYGPDEGGPMILQDFGSFRAGMLAFCPSLGMALDVLTPYGNGAACRLCGTGSRAFYNAFHETLSFQGERGTPTVRTPIYRVVFMPRLTAERYSASPRRTLRDPELDDYWDASDPAVESVSDA